MNVLYIILGALLMYLGYKLLLISSKQLQNDNPNQHGIDYVAENWKGNQNLIKANSQVQRTLFCMFVFVGGMLLIVYGLASMFGITFKF